MDWWRILAHRHWITLRVFGVPIRVCARCTGYVSGLFLLTTLLQRVDLRAYHELPSVLQVVPCVLLATPLVFDWLTQTWRLRGGDNLSRYLTGFLVGVGIALLSRSSIGYDTQVSLTASLAGGITIAGLLGKVIYPMTGKV